VRKDGAVRGTAPKATTAYFFFAVFLAAFLAAFFAFFAIVPPKDLTLPDGSHLRSYYGWPE
jgi:hypothetical protein